MKQEFKKKSINRIPFKKNKPHSKLKFGWTGPWNAILEDLNNDVLISGKPLDTLATLNRLRVSMYTAAIILVPVSIFLYVQSPLFLSINLIWLVVFFYPKIHLNNLSQDRKKKIEEELSIFALFSSVMQNVGINLYDSFQLFKYTGIFNAIGRESVLLKRNVEIFGLSQMEALEDLGRTHKSELFRNLLLGYTSIWRSGGDLSLYLESRADEFFTIRRQKYDAYSNNVANVVEALVTLLLILPIMIMVVSFVLPGSSLEQITLLTVIGLPLFSIIMAIVISSIQPASFNNIGPNQLTIAVLAALGFVSAIISFILSSELWIAIAVGVMLPSGISTIITLRHQREISKSEQSLPTYLRDMTEYKKIGYDIIQATLTLTKENLYTKALNKKLSEIGMLLDTGLSPTKSVSSVNFRSWFVKTSFYLLSFVSEFGGGNPKTLETITQYVVKSSQTVKAGQASVSALTMIIFVAPLIMAFTAGMIMSILGSFDPELFQPSNVLDQLPNSASIGLDSNFVNLISITPQFISMIKILIITSSLLGAFVITKAIDFTFYNAWRVVAIGLISIASIIMMENFANSDLNLDSILGGISFGI